MPRATEVATYTQAFLIKLSRTELQAHAKRKKIKANGKSSAIIAGLLGKSIDSEEEEEEPHASGSRLPPLAETSRPEEPADVPADVPALLPPATRTGEIGKAKSPKTSQRRKTPYPQAASRSGTPASDATQVESVDGDEQAAASYITEHDVRVVRRRITAMVNDQASFQEQMGYTRILLNGTEEGVSDCIDRVHALAWKRRAIEKTVLGKWKEDRHLWDGTAKLGAGQQITWRRFVKKYWRGNNPHDESDSEESLESSNLDDWEGWDAPEAGIETEEAEEVEQELLPQDGDRGVEEEEDDMYL